MNNKHFATLMRAISAINVLDTKEKVEFESLLKELYEAYGAVVE